MPLFNMKSWVLSIISTVFVVSLIILILPNGKLSKYIKSTLSLVVVLVIVSPLFKLNNIEINFENIFANSNVIIQQEYIDYVNQEKIKTLIDKCQILISEIGVEGAKTSMDYYVDEQNTIIILDFTVYLKNAVINSENEHIVIIDKLKNTLSEFLKINKEQVVVYE